MKNFEMALLCVSKLIVHKLSQRCMYVYIYVICISNFFFVLKTPPLADKGGWVGGRGGLCHPIINDLWINMVSLWTAKKKDFFSQPLPSNWR